MSKQDMLDKLNEQINLEFYSSNLYLQMAAWCEFKALSGCSQFLAEHAQEEMMHMQRLFTYVNETGALAKPGQPVFRLPASRCGSEGRMNGCGRKRKILRPRTTHHVDACH